MLFISNKRHNVETYTVEQFCVQNKVLDQLKIGCNKSSRSIKNNLQKSSRLIRIVLGEQGEQKIERLEGR